VFAKPIFRAIIRAQLGQDYWTFAFNNWGKSDGDSQARLLAGIYPILAGKTIANSMQSIASLGLVVQWNTTFTNQDS
jgi:hypothetical protein